MHCATAALVSAMAATYSRSSRATTSAVLCTALMLPIPCPHPQMSFHALAEVLPPEPKSILVTSPSGRLSGSSPAAMIEGRK
eukprot:scaffold274111_cov36-Tisochrysis_lutea.AAC.2